MKNYHQPKFNEMNYPYTVNLEWSNFDRMLKRLSNLSIFSTVKILCFTISSPVYHIPSSAYLPQLVSCQ